MNDGSGTLLPFGRRSMITLELEEEEQMEILVALDAEVLHWQELANDPRLDSDQKEKSREHLVMLNALRRKVNGGEDYEIVYRAVRK